MLDLLSEGCEFKPLSGCYQVAKTWMSDCKSSWYITKH